MGTILDTIIAEKQKEVRLLKEQPVLHSILTNHFHTRHSLLDRLKTSTHMSVIAEYKRASPSKGLINDQVQPNVQVLSYVEAGADAISVLTDKQFFQGSFEDLTAVRSVIDSPILCKDFIIDRIQIDYAKSHGATLILLIAAALSTDELHELYHYAKSLGLEVLMEVHNEMELEKVLTTDNLLIGVNNRDLKTFHVDLQVTEKLAPSIQEAGRYLISESGISTVSDVLRVAEVGAKAILVGESLMRTGNPKELLQSLKLPLPRVVNR